MEKTDRSQEEYRLVEEAFVYSVYRNNRDGSYVVFDATDESEIRCSDRTEVSAVKMQIERKARRGF